MSPGGGAVRNIMDSGRGPTDLYVGLRAGPSWEIWRTVSTT